MRHIPDEKFDTKEKVLFKSAKIGYNDTSEFPDITATELKYQ